MKRIIVVLLLILSGICVSHTHASSAQGCTTIELYPGYPGYRGVVAGLIGRGDTACLESLQSQNPKFNRGQEDTANLEAALRLGVTGTFTDWTWETWAAIGEMRGIGQGQGSLGICYFCIMLDQNVVPVGPEPFIAPDPRTQNSLRAALVNYFQLTGSINPDPNDIVELFSSNDWDRVRGFLFSELPLPTVNELNTSTLESEGATLLDQDLGNCIVNARGGYSYLFPSAHPQDQMWSVTLGMLLAPLTNGQLATMLAASTLSNAISVWAPSDHDLRFVDYLVQYGYPDC